MHTNIHGSKLIVNHAHFSHKISGSDDTVELGEKDKYIPLARHAFVAARKK